MANRRVSGLAKTATWATFIVGLGGMMYLAGNYAGKRGDTYPWSHDASAVAAMPSAAAHTNASVHRVKQARAPAHDADAHEKRYRKHHRADAKQNLGVEENGAGRTMRAPEPVYPAAAAPVVETLEDRLVADAQRHGMSGTCTVRIPSDNERGFYSTANQGVDHVVACGNGQTLYFGEQFAGIVGVNGNASTWTSYGAGGKLISTKNFTEKDGAFDLLHTVRYNVDGKTAVEYAPKHRPVLRFSTVKDKKHVLWTAAALTATPSSQGEYCEVGVQRNYSGGKELDCDLYGLDKKGKLQVFDKKTALSRAPVFVVVGDNGSVVNVRPRFDLGAKQNHKLKDMYNHMVPHELRGSYVQSYSSN